MRQVVTERNKKVAGGRHHQKYDFGGICTVSRYPVLCVTKEEGKEGSRFYTPEGFPYYRD